MTAGLERGEHHAGIDVDALGGMTVTSPPPAPKRVTSGDLAGAFASVDWKEIKRAFDAMSAAILRYRLGPAAPRRELRRTETPARSRRHAEYRRKTRGRNRNRGRR